MILLFFHNRPKAGPQLIVKCLMNIITDDILGSSSPRCSYPQNGECNISEITLSTVKALSYYGKNCILKL